ncbi:MAG TPA: acetoacetate decarboxylase family protein [Pseudomonadales bacterium]
MLVGTASIEALAAGAAEVAAFHAHAIELSDVVCFQLTAEMRNSAREAVLPPGLHPTIPAALSVQVFEVGMSPWGAFDFATVRISCRSGVRARGFSRGTLVSSEVACAGLRDQLGFPARQGSIRFRHGYDGVSVDVTEQGHSILRIEAIDPEPMALDDVQYTGTLNLAKTPLGLRLMQVEMNSSARRVERLTARLEVFDGRAWGDERLVPSRVIAAAVSEMTATFPPVRFVCRPDELAFTGTEAVG